MGSAQERANNINERYIENNQRCIFEALKLSAISSWKLIDTNVWLTFGFSYSHLKAGKPKSSCSHCNFTCVCGILLVPLHRTRPGEASHANAKLMRWGKTSLLEQHWRRGTREANVTRNRGFRMRIKENNFRGIFSRVTHEWNRPLLVARRQIRYFFAKTRETRFSCTEETDVKTSKHFLIKRRRNRNVTGFDVKTCKDMRWPLQHHIRSNFVPINNADPT